MTAQAIRHFLAPVLALALGCGSQPSDGLAPADEDEPTGKADGIDEPVPAKVPKRIILMIGDGMGVAAVSGAAHTAEEPLAMLSMKHVGFMTTHEHEFVTTDSAASATAMATGTKTHFEGVGIAAGTDKDDEDDPDTHLGSIIDAARDAGWRTGLVSTTSVVDATPAAFGAHRAKRGSKEAIALDLRHSGVDVLIGGGRKFFDDRNDGQNLLSQLSSDGYSIAKTGIGLERVSGKNTKVIGLLHDGDMPEVTSGERALELPTLVAEALDILDTDNDDGFFLMVEGAQIDRREHELDGEGALAEARDFDAAVAVALEYARGRDDTLVVVTADHETGGLVIADPTDTAAHIDALGGIDDALKLAASGGFGEFAPAFTHLDLGDASLAGDDVADRRLLATFGDMSLASRPFWSGPTFAFRAAHTPVMVPVFVEGPASSFVARTQDNAELGQRLQMLAHGAAQADDGADPEPEPEDVAPKHVVVVLTDLVGLPALTAAHYTSGQLDTTQLPVRGLVSPVASDRLVPDAAAAATAIATGKRGATGALPPADLATVLETAELAGKKTGIVTTGRLTDSLPAAFFAHAEPGDDEALADAAIGFVGDGLDVVFAGGADAFEDAQLDAWADDAELETEWTNEPVADDVPAVRLVADGALDAAADRASGASEHPTLATMVETALDGLTRHDEGSVLVVVAAGPTEVAARHGGGEALVSELVDLDVAVSAAVAVAQEREDTAVLVLPIRDATTSVLDNHYGFHKKHCGVTERCDGPETLTELVVAIGEFARSAGMLDDDLQGDFGAPRLFVQSSWLTFRAHLADAVPEVASAHFVPLFATGPGTHALGGFHPAPAIGELLLDWVR